MKLTLDGLKKFATAYVDAQKQAGKWTESHNNLYKVADKIGKMVTIDGEFNDELPELSGEDLPLGKTIEEYFIDLTLPVDFKDPKVAPDAGGFAESALKPYLPDVEETCYSFTLGRKVIPTSIPFNDVERGAINSAEAGKMVAKISEKFEQSYSTYRYALKKQLLGNMAKKAIAVKSTLPELVGEIDKVTDTLTGEAFLKQVLTDIETLSFANEKHCLSGALIGKAPKGALKLYVKKGIIPTLRIDVESGAFNGTAITLPVEIKVLDDFGDQNIAGMLVDTRGVKLCGSYESTRSQENGFSDFVNLFRHTENTGYISKYTAVKVYTEKVGA